MKRILLPVVLLTLLATSVVLAGPPLSVWFQDSFDTYGTGKLADKAPKWGYAQVLEPGTSSAFDGGTTDVNVKTGDKGACTTPNFVVMQGYQGNWGARSLSDPAAAAAETQRPPGNNPGVAWDAQSAGQVQILHFKMKRAYDELSDPPLHAGIYLIDNNLFNPQPIMGWVMSCKAIRPQLNLPNYAAPNWTSNRYYSPEGTVYPLPADENCRAFTAIYDPATGDAKFYVDAISETIPLWTGNAGTGRASRSLYIRDFGWHGGAKADVVYLDDVAVGTTSKPVVTAPVAGVFATTATPTITWTKAFPAQTRVNYRIRVCDADDPNSMVYQSPLLTDSATSHVPGMALPTNQQLWAFVTETYTSSTGWSLTGNGGFYCATSAPTTPTVTSPSGQVIGAKPSVIFSGGVLHNQMQVKVTSDLAGNNIVWQSGTLNTLKSGAACGAMLTPATQYYAFAQASNPVGASAWSAASAFTVTRQNEGTDIMNMEETWGGESVIDHSGNAGSDGFFDYCGGGRNWISIKPQVLPDPLMRYADSTGRYPTHNGLAGGTPIPTDWWPSNYVGNLLYDPGVYIIPPIPDRPAPSYVLDIWDTASTWDSNDIRQHKVSGIDLDKGVTFMTLASGHCYEGDGCGGHSARQVAQEAQIYIMDDYGTGKCMASFRYGQGEVGICTDAASWVRGYYTDDQHNPDPRPGQGWHTVRITGRNRILGDPTTTEWKYYLDEDPTPLITATGSMDQSIAPYGAIVDAIAIGQGDGGLQGNWQYDWTAVNTDGDYAPGEWYSQSAEYDTISEAVSGTSYTYCTINGDAVITAIQLDNSTQIGFWVQDVDSMDRKNVLILQTDTTNVAVGRKVTGISGLLTTQSSVGGMGNETVQAVPVLSNPTCTVTNVDLVASPLAMTGKNLACAGSVDQFPDGADTRYKFVRIVGKITAIAGNDTIYLDDGSGLIDGRDAENGYDTMPGVRIVNPPGTFFGSPDDYYQVDGICAVDKWVELTGSSRVRTILAPTCTWIQSP